MTPETNRLSFNWRFILAWASATALGWVIGVISGSFVIAGATVGLAQWLVLRSRLPRADRWLIATTWGWLTGWLILFLLARVGVLVEGDFGILGGFVMGIALGGVQAYQMRTWFTNHGWWLPISVLAWTAALLIGDLYAGLIVGLATAIPLDLWLRFTSKSTEQE